MAAPELVLLALLAETLRVARHALLAAQPALAGEPPAWRVESDLVAARRLLRDAATLERSIVRYRELVLQRVHDAPEPDDDLPF